MTKMILLKKGSDPLWKIGKQLKEAKATTKKAKEDYERAQRAETKLVKEFNERRLEELKERMVREGKGWCSLGVHIADIEKLSLYVVDTGVFDPENVLHTSCGTKSEQATIQKNKFKPVFVRYGRFYRREERRDGGWEGYLVSRPIHDQRSMSHGNITDEIAKKWGIPPEIK